MSLDWWQKNVLYHVYLPSFKDGNNDGIGDFQGLISKLDYFSELGISSLLLSPFYPSPMKDNGYDISSYIDVDPKFGTIEDFDALICELKKRGMNIIIDLVANHTSDQHQWFQKSILKEEPYTDYYIWVDPKLESSEGNPLPPNNWLSVFDGSSWTWNDQRKQFYFHQFLPEQPDLNYRNPAVREEIKNIMRFWLNKGVDGFRIDAASHLIEDERLLDEPVNKKVKASKNEHKYLNHIYTKGNLENLDLVEEWRQLLNEYTLHTNKPKVMLVEAIEDIQDVMLYYGTCERKLAEIPMNFQLYKVKPDFSGIDLHKTIDDWLSMMPKGKYPNWVMSSHDDPRVVTRVGSVLASSLHMVLMLLPGLPIWYYGDELGMENGTIKPEDMKDSFALRTVPSNSRDPMRTPMQWNNQENAGFSKFKPWLPVNSSYKLKNVEVEKEERFSYLNNFRKLLGIRNQPSILFSNLEYPLISKEVFSILRSMEGAECYLLVLNMSSESFSVDLGTVKEYEFPKEATLELTNCEKYHEINLGGVSEVVGTAKDESSIRTSTDASVSGKDVPSASAFPSTSSAAESAGSYSRHEGLLIPLNNIYLGPHQAIVLSYIG